LRELISAYASVRERLPEIGNLAIAGTGRSEFVDELKAMAAGHPIHFVGRVEPYEFFADCSTAVVPSVWAEPFGRVVLEAATAGCRLLISNLGGLPEALTVAGEPAVGASSTLFDPRDPGDFEAALQRAAGLSEFSATNRRTPEDVARDYEQIVSDLLTVRGR
jgi:glycosyltransferase involved in cell wall biosynthesis